MEQKKKHDNNNSNSKIVNGIAKIVRNRKNYGLVIAASGKKSTQNIFPHNDGAFQLND